MSGVFHLLPLGLRVQQKLCQLADEAMAKLGLHRPIECALTSQEHANLNCPLFPTADYGEDLEDG
jgi:prolyl-tRNA synthetase